MLLPRTGAHSSQRDRLVPGFHPRFATLLVAQKLLPRRCRFRRNLTSCDQLVGGEHVPRRLHEPFALF